MCMTFASSTWGQEINPPSDTNSTKNSVNVDTLTKADVEAKLAALDSETSLDDDQKSKLKEIYQSALAQLGQAADDAQLADEYKSALSTGSTELPKLDDQLKGLPTIEDAAAAAKKSTENTTAEESQRLVETSEANLALLQDELAKRTTERNQLTSRPLEVVGRLPVLEQKITEIRKKLDSDEYSAETLSPNRSAEKTLLQAQLKSRQSELDTLNLEQQSQSIREQLVNVQLQIAQKKVEIANAELKHFVTFKKSQLKTEMETITEKANAVLNSDTASMPDKQLAREIVNLVKELDDLIAQLDPVDRAEERMSNRLQQLVEDSEFIKAQLLLGGKGQVIAQLLLDLRGKIWRLGNQSDILENIPALDAARLTNLENQRRLAQQRKLERSLAENKTTASADLVKTRGTLLERVSRESQLIISELSKIAQEKQSYQQKSRELLVYIREQLFWIQSYPPTSFATVKDIPRGVETILSGDMWYGTIDSVVATAKERPVIFVGFIALILGLILARPALGASLKDSSKSTRKISKDRYWHTINGLWFTVLLSAPLPLMVVFAYWLLSRDPSASRWVQAVSYALEYAMLMVFILSFIYELCYPQGLGHGHFGWRYESVKRVRKKLVWFGLIYVPCMTICLASVRSGVYPESLGRFSFTIAQIVTFSLLWKLLRPTHSFRSHDSQDETFWAVTRVGKVWFPLLTALPCFLIVLASLGYFFTATHLALQILASTGILLSFVVAYWMTYRWYAVKARQIALTEALARRKNRLKMAEEGRDDSIERINVKTEEDLQLDIASIGDQTRHLLKTAFTLGFIVVISMLWAETLPLFTALNQVGLFGGITLLSICQAVLVIILFSVGVRNLPGLLELSILRTKTLDAGTRFAITRIAQYVVIGVGCGILFSILKIDWSQFGWIAAALSVGLGFGLQEVVANFVCGLIVLFERPVRVGDVVTLDTTTGTVSKIQMRATTITNWERQELIVPNKNLITGTILNWTLSSSISRIVLPVGVAYGTDTDRARTLLLQAAKNHPLIVEDPAPSTSFDQFADSSLIITLRCFIPSLDERLKTISELHSEIARLYAEENIEMAFPQMDLHVRSVDPAITEAMGQADQ